MISRFAKYKKERLVKLKDRIVELEAENLKLKNEKSQLLSDVYYLEEKITRNSPSIKPGRK